MEFKQLLTVSDKIKLMQLRKKLKKKEGKK